MVNTEQKIIDEIEEIRRNDIEEMSYIKATLEWMEENDIKLTKSSINANIPSYIINQIKDEAYSDNMVRPSNNPNMMVKDGDAFSELFF